MHLRHPDEGTQCTGISPYQYAWYANVSVIIHEWLFMECKYQGTRTECFKTCICSKTHNVDMSNWQSARQLTRVQLSNTSC